METIAEMADKQNTEMVEQQETEMVEGTDNNNDAPNGADASELEEIRKALKKANAEAKKYRLQASKYEELETQRKEAEMTELEKLQAKLADAEKRTNALQRETLQRKIAAEMGLPEALALRLQGDDEDAMKADAESILAAMPKPQPPRVQPTNPANGQPPKETPEQRRARIYSGGQANSNGFDPENAPNHGGGVVWRETNN